MKIKYKFTLIITVIMIFLGLSLNISVRKILKDNMENSIINSLKEVTKSARESIKYTLSIRDYILKDIALVQEADYLIEYISLNYESKLRICDVNGKVISSNLSEDYIEFSENLNEINEGKTIVNIKYSKNSLTGLISYPLIINQSYIGIINLTKDYSILFMEYKKAINTLTLIEISLIIFIFFISYRLTNKIVKPIETLTYASKKLSEGNYNINIDIKGNDEISILSKEFINMKTKIQEQILEIEKEKEKVEKLALSRKIFFDTVTHELKTPLTSIMGYSEMIIQNIVDDENFKVHALDRIYSESNRLNKLVLEIINISKGLSSINEEFISMDIAPLIESISSDMNIKAKKYNLNIYTILESGEISIKANKIKEVLINLLDNAIKYSIESTIIIVNSYICDNFYIIDIINEANPIPDYVYQHIFEPFVKSNTSEDLSSTGLGLYLCKEIIKEHDGIIKLDNGDTIISTIKLPLSNNHNKSIINN
ncbi:HAMP domain-containing sensor histidine kinase [Clostridium isatidis]|uniref:HAMP domain-containing sensor histidine kinase n=1 Tax=Clostridium isatidis TaxID=182773 RepID=UPI003AABFE6F